MDAIEANLNNYNAIKQQTLQPQPTQNIQPIKYEIGDLVRIRQSAFKTNIGSKIRQIYKQGQDKKYIPVKWSVEPYTIVKIYKPNFANGLPYYSVADKEGETLYNDDDTICCFRQNELMKIPEEGVQIK